MRFRPTPLALALFLSCASLATAQAADTRSYQIAATTLEDALNQFGRQSGVLISFGSQLTQGVQSRGLTGDYTPQQGLDALLEGTGLQARAEGENAFSLQPQAAPRSSWVLPAWWVTGWAKRRRTTCSATRARVTWCAAKNSNAPAPPAPATCSTACRV